MLLTMGEVFVRLATTAIEGDEAQTLLNRHATEADRAEAEKHTRMLRRNQTLIGRAALRRLLTEATGVDGALWRLARDATGRPVAQHPNGTVGPEISLAHSGSWTACAVASAGAIGIDIEVPNGRRDANGMATFLSDSERMAVAREGETAFLDFWTLREALAKADGGTVLDALMLDGLDLVAARRRVAVQSTDGRPCVVGHRTLPGIHIAVAWFTITDDATALLETALASLDAAQYGGV
jgi:phosphopantetheinyl transferase